MIKLLQSIVVLPTYNQSHVHFRNLIDEHTDYITEQSSKSISKATHIEDNKMRFSKYYLQVHVNILSWSTIIIIIIIVFWIRKHFIKKGWIIKWDWMCPWGVTSGKDLENK